MMSLTRKTIFALTLGVIAIPALASFTLSDWKYTRSITLPAITSEGYVGIDIDADVYAHAQRSLGDLRVISEGNEEVPYQRMSLSTVDESRSQNFSVHDISETRNGDTIFLLDVRADMTSFAYNQVTIPSSSENFKRMVEVYASDRALPTEADGWRLLTDTGTIYAVFDPTFRVYTRNAQVYYPESRAKYLKVIVKSGEGKFVLDNGASFFGGYSRSSQVVSVTETYVASIAENAETKATEITIDRGTSGTPMLSILLSAPQSTNFSRYAVLQSSDDGVRFARVAEGTLFGIHTPDFNGEHLSFDGPWTSRYLRVIVQNGDDRPLAWGRNVLLTRPREVIVFSANPLREYRLFYGNPTTVSPNYDLSRFVSYLDLGAVEKGGVLETEILNTDYAAPPEKQVSFLVKYPWILNVVLVFLVLVIVVILGTVMYPYIIRSLPPRDGSAV